MFNKAVHQEIKISDILYDDLHKDERYEHAVLLPLKLSPKPDHRWQDLFVTTYHSKFYPSKIPHTKLHGDMLYVTTFVNDNEERIETYLNIIKLAIAETNRIHKRLCEEINSPKSDTKPDNELIMNIKKIVRNLEI